MKEISIYIKPEKLETVKNILDKHHCGGLTVINAMGCGNQKGFTEEYVGTRTHLNLLPKMKIEIIVVDSEVEDILTELHNNLADGNVGDGKIIIKNVEDAVRIRTFERGEAAI